MNRSSTSLSQASDRRRQSEPRYTRCPLCESPDIQLGTERPTVARRNTQSVKLSVRRWACPACGERFLTSESRRRLDNAAGLGPAIRA